MAKVIHGRRRKQGPRFRVWSTTAKKYITEEMSIDEIQVFLLQEKIFEAVKKSGIKIHKRTKKAIIGAIWEHHNGYKGIISSAIRTGTSSCVAGSQDVKGPWENE